MQEIDSTHPKIILIGGTSHTGKTTLAQSLVAKLSYKLVSTDSLARHPGRPWKENPDLIPAHVQEHYLSMSVEELIEDVTEHYVANVWPSVLALIEQSLDETEGLILEGSAILPNLVADLRIAALHPLWLITDESTLRERIYGSSRYLRKSMLEKKLIDAFLARSNAFNELIRKEAKRFNLVFFTVASFSEPTDLTRTLLE